MTNNNDKKPLFLDDEPLSLMSKSFVEMKHLLDFGNILLSFKNRSRLGFYSLITSSCDRYVLSCLL